MPYTGTFLPSLIWSDDRDEVMREKKRLERVRDRLLAALRQADQIEYAIWYMMTLEALYQLDNEIDRLWNWLDSTAPRKRPRQRKIPEILRQ
ncbi:hypothetical protein ANK1_4032 [plant metagenome]|uniref:Uncharacterized protein n=1 Tax=plant metagenome TaxID=1297885 RepID=A0A484Q4S7_9ZZZZ